MNNFVNINNLLLLYITYIKLDSKQINKDIGLTIFVWTLFLIIFVKLIVYYNRLAITFPYAEIIVKRILFILLYYFYLLEYRNTIPIICFRFALRIYRENAFRMSYIILKHFSAISPLYSILLMTILKIVSRGCSLVSIKI